MRRATICCALNDIPYVAYDEFGGLAMIVIWAQVIGAGDTLTTSRVLTTGRSALGRCCVRVLAIAAMSADGYIARSEHDTVSWSSPEDKRMFAATSRRAGVIVMGRHTFESMPEPLPDRLQIVMTHTPEAFQPSPTQVEFTKSSPDGILRDLATRGFEEVIIGGGGAVYAQFVNANLVDELWLTVEPLLFGSGVPLLSGTQADQRMRLVSVTQLSINTLQLKYALDAENREQSSC